MNGYMNVWDRVRESYETGYCLYERGLQSALYAELRSACPEAGIVVEPHWEQHIPDIVIVRDEEIVDIFELKFAPHWYPDYQGDIHKLLHYSGEQHVTLNPVTGHWGHPLPISDNCRLHFAVVGRSDSDAVRPQNIPDRVILWYGRISREGCDWGVCMGEMHNGGA